MYKTIKKIVATLILTSLFSIAIWAGDTQCPKHLVHCRDGVVNPIDDPENPNQHSESQLNNTADSNSESEDDNLIHIFEIIIDSIKSIV